MPKKGEKRSREAIAKMLATIAAKPAPTTKRCSKCHETKSRDQFSPRSNTPQWLRGECNPCGAAYQRKYNRDNPLSLKQRNYLGAFRKRNTTESEYLAVLAAQNGRCAICGMPPSIKRG